MRFNTTDILIVFLLPLISGAAALSHELLWTRRLVDVLGATDWVTGRVLGLFFLGISIGAFLASRFTFADRSAMFSLGCAELLVGVLSLGAVFLPSWTDWIWRALGTESLLGAMGAIVKLAIAGLVILPPSICMGFTLPFFIRSATERNAQVATVGVWIYAVNTLGGVFGLWITSTYLVDWLGAQAAMLLIAGSNVLVGMAAFWMAFSGSNSVTNSHGRKKADQAKSDKTEAIESEFSRFQLILFSFISGLVVLSLEVLILRLIALVIPSSFHSTSALLANVILILAISSLAVSIFNRLFGLRHWLMIVGWLGCAIACIFCPQMLYEQTDQLISIRYLRGLNGQTIDSINHYWWLVLTLISFSCGLPLLFSGLVFPILLSASEPNDPDGKLVGMLLAANGIGGLLGGELSNSVLIGLVGVYQGFIFLGVFVAIVACGLLARMNLQIGVGVGAVVAFTIFLAARENQEIPYLSPRSKTKFEIQETMFSRDGVLLVVTDPKGSKSILMNNQYVLGSSGYANDERRQLILPWLLYPHADTVCCLGFATGISAAGLERVPNPPAVTAVELSSDVARLAKRHFESKSNGFYARSANQVVIEDARTFMAASDNQFDLIVGDLFRPHGVGEGRLFSREHFQNVNTALTERGLFCQWLPLYQLKVEQFETIAATFQKVFPSTLVVFGNADARTPVIGLLGWKDGADWNMDEVVKRLATVDTNLVVDDPLLSSAESLVVGVLVPNTLDQVNINSLNNMLVEISAGNHWVLHDLTRSMEANDLKDNYVSGRFLDLFRIQIVGQTLSSKSD